MDEAERGAGGAVAEFAADEVGVEVSAVFEGNALLGRNLEFETGESLGGGNGIDADEFEDELFAVPPDVFDFERTVPGEDVGERVEAFEAIGQRQRGDLPFVAARAKDACDGDGGQGVIPEFPA